MNYQTKNYSPSPEADGEQPRTETSKGRVNGKMTTIRTAAVKPDSVKLKTRNVAYSGIPLQEMRFSVTWQTEDDKYYKVYCSHEVIAEWVAERIGDMVSDE